MGFDVESKDLQDVRVIKCYSEVGETIKMDYICIHVLESCTLSWQG